MFTSVYTQQELKDVGKRISQADSQDITSTNYELQEDIAALGMQIAIQDRLLSNLLLRVSQLESKLPLIGI
tara:strand:- start:267 stop:479 length:213 start_codon:yes stop_codon:yes gene_type:complete